MKIRDYYYSYYYFIIDAITCTVFCIWRCFVVTRTFFSVKNTSFLDTVWCVNTWYEYSRRACAHIDDPASEDDVCSLSASTLYSSTR